MDRVQSLVRKKISCIFTCNADIIRICGGGGGGLNIQALPYAERGWGWG